MPSNFRYPASSYVWLGDSTNKTAYKIIRQEDLQLYENNSDNWCYFLLDATPTLEFNPNLTLAAGQTINYNCYKYATKLTTGSSTFEMSDPMFAVYYALSELKKEEGDTTAAVVATQKLEAMKVKNESGARFYDDSLNKTPGVGFGLE